MVTAKQMAKLPKALAEPSARADGSPEGINLSQLMEWMRCRYRWHLRYERRIQGRSVQPKLDLGSAVHAGLAGATKRFAEFRRPRITPKNLELLKSAAVRSTRAWYIEWFKEKGISEDALSSLDYREHIEEIRTHAAQICYRTLPDLELDRWEILRFKNQPLVEQKISTPFFDPPATPDNMTKPPSSDL